ncbi:hypothetical protein F2Q68_00038462 [Brassica cretica]|uniref:Uncharacterized protein n=1 Tax=Brassica cretica TaxID=69181 RepID=A0A8S9MAZ4_BRACR|nr:hypothetical protein F2Q68_00038462 [Brassica cretica]
MDIELIVVAIYTRRRYPCCRFSDPSSLVSVFTVVATTTACHHTGHLSLFQSLSLFLCVLNLFLLLEGGQGRGAWWWRRWTRQRSLVVEEVTKPLCDLKTLELSW